MQNPRLLFTWACTLAIGAGCGSSLQKPDGGGGGAGGSGAGSGADAAAMPDVRDDLSTQIVGRKVDVLFMIDQSSSMRLSQANLQANFSSFTETLKSLPGGLPDLHLAIVTSDLGAGGGAIPGCGASDMGEFQFGVGLAATNCTSTGLAPGATFIQSTGGASPQTNFTGDLTAVFQCIAAVGDTGCGFEHQLASIVRALGADGEAAPATNQGFLRPDAALVIVLLTNEDDCSGPDSLFDPDQTTLASELGPVAGFRCNEFGHLCDGAPPRRTAPTGQVTDTIKYTSCVPAESSGRLTPVATFVSQIKALKPNPAAQILVASIQGPTTSYEVHWRTPSTTDTGPWPEITHSCSGADTSFADPGVRLHRFVEAFGEGGIEFSICEPSFGPALTTLATRLSQLIGS